MAVMLPSTALAVTRQQPRAYDPNGYPIPAGHTAPTEARPARALERPDHSWVLALDPTLWPVTEGDLITETDTGRSWLVVSADLLTNTYDPVVDYIRVEAEVRVGGSTLPPGVNAEGPT